MSKVTGRSVGWPGTTGEVFTMYRNPGSIGHGVPLVFDLGFLGALLLLLTGRSLLHALTGLIGRAATCIGGHLRRRPEPWLEETLRGAFAEIDRDLVAILQHQQAPR
jgi:hypothetical protein